MNMIGSENFIIKRTRTKEGNYNQLLNCYSVSSTATEFKEQLNIDEYQLNELLSLLEQAKEVL